MQYSYLSDTSQTLSIQTRVQGPVFWRPINANPRLNLNQEFFISLFKCLFWIILSVLFRASNNQILDKKNYIKFSFEVSKTKIRFYILGFLEAALNNPAQGSNFQATLSGGVINKWDWTMKLLIYLL